MAEFNLDNERSLFQQCLERPESEWDRLLEDGCEDPDVRLRVRRMLDHHASINTHNDSFLRLKSIDPERIGPYRIMRRLGEGGMGIVYAAEQREPVRRRVAIKVLRIGASSREVLARFDVERQALALMTHANIARILDAGATADHRPYIVMEFVPGESITRFCEHRGLSLRERLLLFCEVCVAVQHAHQRGVIHRDLKPSNILVMEEDGKAIPKIIDFGIAKAILQPLTDQTLETRMGSLLGTPDYMSPEQAELTPLDIDTRTDVYALGAVLYQLLTGTTPLGLSEAGNNFAEVQRLIKEQLPVVPSRRLNGPLQKLVRGELDWITMKALEKDRSHRYASATDLARDIHAFLENDAVTAGPPSHLRKIGKFARKHWLASASLLTIMLTLSVSQLLLLQKNRELQFERDRANLAAADAQEQTKIAKRVVAFTSGLFDLASPMGGGTSDISARAILDGGVRRLQNENMENDAVRAALLEAAGNAYLGLDAYAEAEDLLTEAVNLRTKEAEQDPQSLSSALVSLSRLHMEMSDLDAAEAIARRALALNGDLAARVQLSEILRLKSELVEAAELLVPIEAHSGSDSFTDAVLALGRVRIDEGRFEDGEALVRRALKEIIEAHGYNSAEAVEAQLILGEAIFFKGHAERATEVFREALKTGAPVFGENHRVMGVLLNNLGATLYHTPGALDEAERVYRKALEVNSFVHGNRHLETANVYNNLGNVHLRKGEVEKARQPLRTAFEIRAELLGVDHPETLTTKLSLASVLARTGSASEAVEHASEVIDGFSRTVGARHWRTGNARSILARALVELKRYTEAEVEMRSGVEIVEEALGSDSPRAIEARRIYNSYLAMLERKGIDLEPANGTLLSDER